MINEHKKIANTFVFASAAPNPTANPSKDSAIARERASIGDMIFEESISAFSGLAYKFKINLKFKNENFNSLLKSECFRIIDLVILSNSFIIPSRNKIIKQRVTVKNCGMYCLTAMPTRSDNPKIELQIMFITCIDEKGILILLLP